MADLPLTSRSGGLVGFAVEPTKEYWGSKNAVDTALTQTRRYCFRLVCISTTPWRLHGATVSDIGLAHGHSLLGILPKYVWS
jgi:hypothetical protein